MGKTQKNVSLPRDYTDELQKIFDENKEGLKTIQITTLSELVRVLANLGKPKLLEILSTLDVSPQKHSDTNESNTAQLRKPYKNRQPPEK